MTAILKVIFNIKKNNLKIMTGKGNGVVHNTTKHFLEKNKIKYNLTNNTFILK